MKRDFFITTWSNVAAPLREQKILKIEDEKRKLQCIIIIERSYRLLIYCFDNQSRLTTQKKKKIPCSVFLIKDAIEDEKNDNNNDDDNEKTIMVIIDPYHKSITSSIEISRV